MAIEQVSSVAAAGDAEVEGSTTEPATVGRDAPYPPSVVNRLFDAVERLPARGWWVYPGSFAALIVYHHVMLWATGSRPFGTASLEGVPLLVFGPYALGLTHYLIRVARRSVDAFQPASGLNDQEYAIRRYELLVVPPGRTLVPFLVGSVFAAGSILAAPAAAIDAFGGTTTLALLVFGPAAIFGYGVLAVDVYLIARQLRQIDRLHRDATAIDLFDTAPIYAFSRLTVLYGIGSVAAGYYALIVNGSFQTGNAVSLASIGVVIVLGIACFIVPLWGIHGRLERAKAALVRGGSLRAKGLQEELYRRVDGGDLAGIKEVGDALDGLHRTSERIDKLPTWPWPPALLRGFLSAILLPVIVFLITRYVAAQLP